MDHDPASRLSFFGYGSLVNELTWAQQYEAQPGEIRGWRREWKHCVSAPFGRVCALTVVPKQDTVVQGVFISCSQTELEILDKREIGYRREVLAASEVGVYSGDNPSTVYIYSSTPKVYRSGSLEYPIWLSYVESVLFGYLRVFGHDGIDRFIESTGGWDAPIVDDRSKPLYPRALQLPIEIRTFIEYKITRIEGVNICSPP